MRPTIVFVENQFLLADDVFQFFQQTQRSFFLTAKLGVAIVLEEQFNNVAENVPQFLVFRENVRELLGIVEGCCRAAAR